MRNIIRFITAVQISAALLFCPLTSLPIPSLQDDRASVTTGQGLHVVTFDLTAGKVKVFLPDDMAASDTISGTVSTEANGRSEDERAKNQDTLNGTVVDFGDGNKVKADQRKFTLPPASAKVMNSIRNMKRTVSLLLNDDSPVATAQVPLKSSATSLVSELTWPRVAQTGRPVQITGPFDGNSSNTSCTISGNPAPILAESPRKSIFNTPTNLSGPVEVNVKEGGTSKTGPIRVVSVNLTAAKTSLTKGEKLNTHLEIKGLKGESEVIPFQLITSGTASMEGGNTQVIEIRPDQVSSDGMFIRDFVLTGTQAGNFSVTGTVLVGTPAEAKDACKCVCEFANPPIVTSGNGKKKGVAYQSFEPNMKNTACNGNQCSVKRIEYSWSIGAGSTAAYTVSGGDKSSKELTLDVTKSGTVELSVTVTVICSDGSKCSATGSKTFTVKA